MLRPPKIPMKTPRCFNLLAVCAVSAGPSLSLAQTPTGTIAGEKAVVLNEFAVTEIRSSITKSLDIKRASVQMVDAIVNEDVGKFPDNNLVEAMQRMPGIQVTNRGSGEIATVSIRGLSDINTTFNGINIFTASGQFLTLQDVPAALLSRVDVYKTRSADLIEKGIAGSMNIVTYRPFDFKQRSVVLAGRASYQDEADRYGQNFSGMFTQQWKTPAGKVGALLGLSHIKTPYRDQTVTAGAMLPFVTGTPPSTPPKTWRPYERIFPTMGGVSENPIWIAGLEQGLPSAAGSTLRINNVNVPYVLARDAVIQNERTGTRERPSANLVLQFAPNDKAEYTFESFYQGFQVEQLNNILFHFVDSSAAPVGEVTLYPGTNIVKSRASVANPYSFNSGDYVESKTDSFFHSISGKWQVGDKMTIQSSVTYQTSQFDTSFFAMRAERTAPSITVDFNRADGLMGFSLPDNPATTVNESNLADPSLWSVAQIFDNGDRDKGDAFTWKADGDYKLDGKGIFSSLKFGVFYDDRGATEYDRRQNAGILGQPLTAFPELQHVNRNFFSQASVPHSWVTPDTRVAFRNADKYRALYKARYPTYRTGPELSLFENFDVREKQSAAYLRTDVKTFIGDRRLDGQFGARYVNVETDMKVTDRQTNQVARGSVSKVKVLPSGSVRFSIMPDLLLRLSYAETLRRPDFASLNPYITYVRDVTNIGYGTANGGNQDLRPTESKNYDLALEYYFGRSNGVYLSLFKREVEGLVVPFRRRVSAVVAPDTQPYDYVLSQPANASNGELSGFEVGVAYFPDKLPSLLQGLGAQLSYTGLESQQDIPETDSAGKVTRVLTREFFGVSDSSYSAVIAYEKPKVGVRLSYVWRSGFLANYQNALFASPLGVFRRPEQSMDFQLT